MTEEETDPGSLVDEYTVGGTTHSSTLSEDLRVDRADLSSEYANHATRFGWYATAWEIAQDEEARLKATLERAYAQLDPQARASMAANGIKIVEKKVENMVITNPQYVTVQEEYFAAKLQSGLLKAARDAMIHKKDCLISLGANYRAEAASDPSLLQEQYRKTYNK